MPFGFAVFEAFACPSPFSNSQGASAHQGWTTFSLTQRVKGPASDGSVELEVSHLKDSDVVGLGPFRSPYAVFAVRKNCTPTES